MISQERLSEYCFGELYTGVHYARKGYKFLFEPWLENFLLKEAKKTELRELQLKFQNIFIQQAGQDVFDFITNVLSKKIDKGQPDLFVYRPNDCFFAEIKRERDSLTKEQEIFSNELKKNRIPVPIRLVTLQTKKKGCGC